MPLDLWFESGRSSGRNWSARWLRRFFPEAALASRGLRAWSISFRHPSKGKPHCPGRRSALRKYAFPLATFPQEESADCVGPWQVQSNRYLRRQKARAPNVVPGPSCDTRSEEHTSELQSRLHLVCRLLLEKKKPLSLQTICRHPANL